MRHTPQHNPSTTSLNNLHEGSKRLLYDNKHNNKVKNQQRCNTKHKRYRRRYSRRKKQGAATATTTRNNASTPKAIRQFHNASHPQRSSLVAVPQSPPKIITTCRKTLTPTRLKRTPSKSLLRSFSSDSTKNNSSDSSSSTSSSLQNPAGSLLSPLSSTHSKDSNSDFIPQIPLHESDGRRHKRVLVLCTGGTLTMAPNPARNNSLSPVKGLLTRYMSEMKELEEEHMPEVVTHEYVPLLDSSDLGPTEWGVLANDIKDNYLHFDGFVILMGTDTMAYTATALSFILENLNKPVIFTGSQIPLCEPHNDARRNIIMALIFASRDTINEVSIFFHDRLLRACRATKVDTQKLNAFDSPNIPPLATVGVGINENTSLSLPPARGALRVHSRMETRVVSLRLVPGFDDGMIRRMIDVTTKTHLRALVVQLYGMGNLPSVKDSIIKVLNDATNKGVLVVATTQCFTGSVMMGHYATGQALIEAGVVSASDMTLEAITCKIGYLFGRGDLTTQEVGKLMAVSLRGEVTPEDALPPPIMSSAYQRASQKGKKYY